MLVERRLMGAITALALVAVACGGGGEESDPESGQAAETSSPSSTVVATSPEAEAAADCEDEDITITQGTTGFLYYPSYVAEEAGFYEEAGLNAEVVDVSSGNGAIAAVVGGSADVALATTSSAIEARSEGAPVVAFAGLVGQYASEMIVKKSILDEAGISEDTPPEERLAVLDGLRIGFSSAGSGTSQIAHYLVNEGGFDPQNDVELVAVGNSTARITAFSRGDLDAVVLSPPFTYLAAQQGEGEFLFKLVKGEYPPLEGTLYESAITSDETLENRRDVLVCFATAIARAQQLIKEDPERAAELARSRFPEVDDELYHRALEDQQASYVDTPVISRDSAVNVLSIVNTGREEPLPESVVDEAINQEIAEEAMEGRE